MTTAIQHLHLMYSNHHFAVWMTIAAMAGIECGVIASNITLFKLFKDLIYK